MQTEIVWNKGLLNFMGRTWADFENQGTPRTLQCLSRSSAAALAVRASAVSQTLWPPAMALPWTGVKLTAWKQPKHRTCTQSTFLLTQRCDHFYYDFPTMRKPVFASCLSILVIFLLSHSTEKAITMRHSAMCSWSLLSSRMEGDITPEQARTLGGSGERG